MRGDCACVAEIPQNIQAVNASIAAVRITLENIWAPGAFEGARTRSPPEQFCVLDKRGPDSLYHERPVSAKKTGGGSTPSPGFDCGVYGVVTGNGVAFTHADTPEAWFVVTP